MVEQRHPRSTREVHYMPGLTVRSGAARSLSRARRRDAQSPLPPGADCCDHWACPCRDAPGIPNRRSHGANYEDLRAFADTNHVLGVVVTTVMCLASGTCDGAMADHLRCTVEFLQKIKDDRGLTPYNIARIIGAAKRVLATPPGP